MYCHSLVLQKIVSINIRLSKDETTLFELLILEFIKYSLYKNDLEIKLGHFILIISIQYISIDICLLYI